jgi:hypothetical protein
MSNDVGLFTDGMGEGMAGATDVSLETIYNGSSGCKGCGKMMNPLESLRSIENQLCPSCSRREKVNLVKGRMA